MMYVSDLERMIGKTSDDVSDLIHRTRGHKRNSEKGGFTLEERAKGYHNGRCEGCRKLREKSH